MPIDKPTVELLYLPVPVRSDAQREVVHRHGRLAARRRARRVSVLLFANWAGLGPVGMSWVTPAAAGRLARGGLRRAAAVRAEPAGQHPQLPPRRRARDDDWAGSRGDGPAGQAVGRRRPGEVLYALRLLERGPHGTTASGRARPAATPVRRGARRGHPHPRRVQRRGGRPAGREAAARPRARRAHPGAALPRAPLAHRPARPHREAGRVRGLLDPRGDGELPRRSPGSHTNIDAARLLLDRMLQDEEPRTRLEAARLLELLPDHFEDQIRAVLTSGETEQVRHAIHAVGKLRKRKLVGRVVDRLGDPALVGRRQRAPGPVRRPRRRHAARLPGRTPTRRSPSRRAVAAVLQRIGTAGRARASWARACSTPMSRCATA